MDHMHKKGFIKFLKFFYHVEDYDKFYKVRVGSKSFWKISKLHGKELEYT